MAVNYPEPACAASMLPSTIHIHSYTCSHLGATYATYESTYACFWRDRRKPENLEEMKPP